MYAFFVRMSPDLWIAALKFKLTVVLDFELKDVLTDELAETLTNQSNYITNKIFLNDFFCQRRCDLQNEYKRL